MSSPITVGVIGATGSVGQSVVKGLLSSEINFSITSFTRQTSIDSPINQNLRKDGLAITGYDLAQPQETLVNKLRGIDILISCMNWENLHLQKHWVEPAKSAGVKRFVPSEWVAPTPPGISDVQDTKLDILAAIQRAHLSYTVIDVGCWFEVFVPKIPSGRSDHAHWSLVDHRIVGDGNQKFALIDRTDIGKYVAQIITDPRTINKHVFAYTEVLSMNEIWDTMTIVSGEEPVKDHVMVEELEAIIQDYPKKVENNPETAYHPSRIQDTVNFNMAQFRISWCVRGYNTPEYGEYLGYLDFTQLFPDFPKGKSLKTYYREVVNGSAE
ncbi:hypothetical protein N7499_004031 [Penicillium canescens]|uniref:NmrA-like domain-containing protein n=1 Tax=Penicillium canescens TaxID=5083 RepID=A0AAD6IMB6_PENCN|nr:uncharacterized protein N7446_007543 [Penicillium canescens]KAJ5991616.1 hypothetical protein N7522_011823 [Penicillium canescens]KAJ6052898.1 hypothetical protein N7460_003432 [Penicillium canescens]KAJ6063423.1 hypothetical protein N7446_007543 [Penicillium canescens]KAJ6089184.1 hypothetical protein N7499_004031 [Penicillium canescens]KAJ6181534.1 hypothetical protein N7485_000176 [Penicillium canescens]